MEDICYIELPREGVLRSGRMSQTYLVQTWMQCELTSTSSFGWVLDTPM